jgi:hypothetical protein
MSQKLGTLERPISGGEQRSAFNGRIPILAVGLAVVLIVALWAAVLIPGGRSVSDPAPATASLSANPELMVWTRYVKQAASQSEDAKLASNPELMAAARFSEEAAQHAEAASLATNPELKALRWHRALSGDEADSLSLNPELATYRRYVMGLDS